MKNLNKVVAIILMAVFFNTVSAEPINASNGFLQSTKNYTNGQQNGQQTTWHKNGTKASAGNYKNGLPDGSHTTWYDDGRIKSEINYKNGKQHGPETRWYRAKFHR